LEGNRGNLEVAKASVKAMVETAPGDYLIFSPTTGNKTVIKLKECA